MLAALATSIGPACVSTVTVLPICPVDEAEVEALSSAADHLAAFRGRRRRAVATACVGMAQALSEDVDTTAPPFSQADAAAACGAAKRAIESRLDQGADLSAHLDDYGDCDVFVAAETRCLGDCGDGATCADSCSAAATFQGGCRDPVLRITSTDTELATAVETHFGAILALDLFVANTAGDAHDDFDSASQRLDEALVSHPGCGVLAARRDRAAMRGDHAYDELIDMLKWLRISRLSVAD